MMYTTFSYFIQKCYKLLLIIYKIQSVYIYKQLLKIKTGYCDDEWIYKYEDSI